MDHYSDSLAEAQARLGRRASREFDGGGDPMVGGLFEALADVVDYSRRVGLPTASERYRCEKSLPLVMAAVAVMRQAFVTNAGADDAFEVIEEATGLVRDLVRAVLPVLWSATADRMASYGPPAGAVDSEDAQRAQGVAEAIRVWAEKLAAQARPVDDDRGVW